MLKGYGMIGTRLENRLPITLTILRRIILAASQLDDSFLLLYMSISGYVVICFSHILKGGGNHQLSRTQLHLNQVLKLLNDRQEVQAIQTIFLSHKQNYKKAPFSLVVSRQNFLLRCPAFIGLLKTSCR